MIACSFSSIACELKVQFGIGVKEETNLLVTSLLEKKGYIVTSEVATSSSKADMKVFVFGEEMSCYATSPSALEVKLNDVFKGKGGYSLQHSFTGNLVKKQKTYRLRRFANQENIELAIEAFINNTVPECI